MIPIALASDTFSIAVMEIVDNAIMLVDPGRDGGWTRRILFWGALSVPSWSPGGRLPVNRWLIARGKGHAVVHETGLHGCPHPARARRSPS